MVIKILKNESVYICSTAVKLQGNNLEFWADCPIQSPPWLPQNLNFGDLFSFKFQTIIYDDDHIAAGLL